MDDLIQQGVNAFKAGDKETARKLLSAAIKQNPDSERAWGWTYNVCNNDQERIQCLKQIIRINPNNEKAKQRLNELTLSDFPLESPTPQAVPDYHQHATPAMTSSPVSTKKKSNTLLYFLVIAICLACVGLSVIGTAMGIIPKNTPQPAANIPPTQTDFPRVVLEMDLVQFVAKYDSLTDIQKKDFVGQSVGKWVTWSGEIYDVQSNGTIMVNIPGTLVSLVNLKGVSQENAVRLSKGETIHFTGRITNVSNVIGLYIYLEDVQLK